MPTTAGVDLPLLLRPLFLLALLRCGWLEWAAAMGEGFCAVSPTPGCSSESKHPPLYWKVTNPTLSPEHLQDLPGFTRSVYRRDHAVITPESHVFSPLPDWVNTLGAYLITPAMGAHFSMYLAKMQASSHSTLPAQDVERFLFVVEGTATLSNWSGSSHSMPVDSYAYLPANSDHTLKAEETATLVVFERRYVNMENHIPKQIIGLTDRQPLLETPGEVFQLRKLLPTSAAYDFNIHIMDFQPGEYLNVKEVHYNQHGLLLLEGQGIYRLGDNWYPVQAGDAIWMAPFVPQWYAALGKSRTRRCEQESYVKIAAVRGFLWEPLEWHAMRARSEISGVLDLQEMQFLFTVRFRYELAIIFQFWKRINVDIFPPDGSPKVFGSPTNEVGLTSSEFGLAKLFDAVSRPYWVTFLIGSIFGLTQISVWLL